jgi:hypothetical protein
MPENTFNQKTAYRIAIIDSNRFSRNWSASLLMRDLRTQVVAEHKTIDDFVQLQQNSIEKIDGVLINLPAEYSNDQIQTGLSSLSKLKIQHKILVTSQPNEVLLDALKRNLVSSVLLMDEMDNALGWAVVLTCAGYHILTPTILQMAYQQSIHMDQKWLVFTGNDIEKYLSPSQIQYARLAFLMSMSRGSLADELQIGVNSSFTLISRLYEHIGVNELMEENDRVDLTSEDTPYFQANYPDCALESTPKAARPTKESLAFHIVTKPIVQVIGEW